MIHIGIDPDVEKPGVSIIKDGQYSVVMSMTITDLFDLITECRGDECVTFYVENVRTNTATYHRDKSTARSKQSVQNAISQRVGMVKAAEMIICKVIKRNGCNLVMVKPKPKRNASYFKRVTGWQGVTNQDNRDAAMLIFRFLKQDRKTITTTKGE